MIASGTCYKRMVTLKYPACKMVCELLARQGLRFPAIILRRPGGAGIYCQPTVSIERQHFRKRYVLRGVNIEMPPIRVTCWTIQARRRQLLPSKRAESSVYSTGEHTKVS